MKPCTLCGADDWSLLDERTQLVYTPSTRTYEECAYEVWKCWSCGHEVWKHCPEEEPV
jgi:hypothetical protein